MGLSSAPGEGWPEKLEELLEGRSVVGVETSMRMEIATTLGRHQLRALPLVEELRIIKSGDEILAIRRAASYADYGMTLMCKALYRGVSPLEMFALARKIQTKTIIAKEFDPLASEILTACWPAPSSAKPHGVPELGDRLGSGPIQNMSFLRVMGYAAECERTVFIERPTTTSRELFSEMLEARALAFSLLRPGTPCADIDAATRAHFKARGLSGNLLHRCGHGIGLSNHEGPWLSGGSEERLGPSMVVSIEPAIYLPELGGFRHSDTVLITEGGFECLTKFPTSIDELVFTQPRLLKRLKGRVFRSVLGM